MGINQTMSGSSAALTKMLTWGFSLSIPHSLGRALDLLKHFKTPARSLSAGEARKVLLDLSSLINQTLLALSWAWCRGNLQLSGFLASLILIKSF